MAKVYRRFIKINGLSVGSPSFKSKGEADDWYAEKKEMRDKVKDRRLSAKAPLFIDFAAQCVKQFMVDYEKPTWQGYESNIRLHLLPYLKDYRIDEITRTKCREVLMNVVRNGHSVNHRKHVQTTLSKIFVAAMNADPPIVESSPVFKLTFEGRRTATKFTPAILETEAEVAQFMRIALDFSDQHWIISCLGFMAALRRGEIIGLKWRSVRWASNEIRVSHVYREAMGKITQSTKSGENVHRDVPVPRPLLKALQTYRERSKYQDDGDYILCREDGTHFRSRDIHNRFNEVRVKAGRPDLTPHSMRHTYGRLFALKTAGNTKALQTIFGHSTQAMTSRYSELTTKQIRPLAEKMGMKISDDPRREDTKTTQRRGKP
jgi:integrase